jgi:hypothetical protein
VSEPHDSGRNFDAAPMQALYSKNEIKLTKELGLFFIVTFTIEIVTAFVTVFVTLKKSCVSSAEPEPHRFTAPAQSKLRSFASTTLH